MLIIGLICGLTFFRRIRFRFQKIYCSFIIVHLNSIIERTCFNSNVFSMFQMSSQEVLINVCDQVVERSSKILAQRSKSVAAKLITTKELKDLGRLIDILAAETFAMTGKVSLGKIFFKRLLINWKKITWA